jgi:hypothetical protein
VSARVNLHDVPGRLGVHLGRLDAALATWATRDDSKAQPEVTRAGHTAVEAIDTMLAELHWARQQLVAEVRQHQDAAMARVDALLQRSKADRLAERAMDVIDRAIAEGRLPG